MAAENEKVRMLEQLAADTAREADVGPASTRDSLLRTAAIYEVGAALLEQLVKLTRAVRN